MTWRLRSCPRCRGDMYLDEQKSWHCLQCGRLPVEQNKRLAVSPGAFQCYPLDNGRPLAKRQGVVV